MSSGRWVLRTRSQRPVQGTELPSGGVVHVEAGGDRDRRPVGDRAGGHGEVGRAAALGGAAGLGVVADRALDVCLGRHREVHRQRRLLDRLLPAARDQLPVEHRVDVLAGDPLVVLGEHAVDVVLDHVGVLADVERGVGAADLGHPLAVVVLPAQLERLVAAVAGDRDVLGRAPCVRRVVVDDVPEPEDAVLAVAREVDRDRLGHVHVAVRRDVEVRHVVGDRGVFEGGRDRARCRRRPPGCRAAERSRRGRSRSPRAVSRAAHPRA